MFSETGWKLSLHERLFVLKQPLSWERDASWGLAHELALIQKPMQFTNIYSVLQCHLCMQLKMTNIWAPCKWLDHSKIDCFSSSQKLRVLKKVELSWVTTLQRLNTGFAYLCLQVAVLWKFGMEKNSALAVLIFKVSNICVTQYHASKQSWVITDYV